MAWIIIALLVIAYIVWVAIEGKIAPWHNDED